MRVNKQGNKFFVYLSNDLVSALGLSENEEIEFLPFNQKSFLVAKKSDLASLLIDNAQQKNDQQRQQNKQGFTQQSRSTTKTTLSEDELFVLKKLDELRYNLRTVENVNKILDNKYKPVLQQLLKIKAVTLFKGKEGKDLYSISKIVYDNFLMRKKIPLRQETKDVATVPIEQKNTYAQFFYKKTPSIETGNAEVEELDKNGFIVLQTEAEAAGLSLLLEDSIKHGMVIGTRAFNRKFYIVTRAFFEKHSSDLIKLLREKPMKISDLAANEKIDEEAVRGIMYLLAEAGDAREQRKDLFALA